MSPGVSGKRQLHEGGCKLRVVREKCRTEEHFAGEVGTGTRSVTGRARDDATGEEVTAPVTVTL